MKIRHFLTLFPATAVLSLPIYAATCESLANLSLAHVSITVAKSIPPGRFVAEDTPPIPDLPAFCRVAATLSPTPDSYIRIEVWLPTAGWNGKYEGTGNGGFAGKIGYGSLGGGLRRGYAVANTDMGTSHPADVTPDVFIGHPEKWADWGWRATHEMTVVAKQIVIAYYGQEPKPSYFVGCSTGGEQAWMEAQRFPDDYDGIVAGAPANNRTGLHTGIFWSFAAAEADSASYIPAEKLPAITQALLSACTTAKAAPSDAFLSSPEECHWDPNALLCQNGDAPGCLTAQQVKTAQKIYNGAQDPVTHKTIYPGVPRGAEFGWPGLMPQSGAVPFESLFKWALGPAWNWRTFDFDRDFATLQARLSPAVDAVNPDLSLFKAHGHKILAFHGWSDWLVYSGESINYYHSVTAAQAAPAAANHRTPDEETQTFYRLFMVPGMSHCAGGPGLTNVDPLPSLELWVEKGIAPDELVAWRAENAAIKMTRPVCPFPQSARYNGTGAPKDAASFTCANPSK
ncbi:MAG: tannase/feruloyl esterase family alpha/beta hydrolase [Terracidiphilus sp.]|jgi:feruloyl esterase